MVAVTAHKITEAWNPHYYDGDQNTGTPSWNERVCSGKWFRLAVVL